MRVLAIDGEWFRDLAFKRKVVELMMLQPFVMQRKSKSVGNFFVRRADTGRQG